MTLTTDTAPEDARGGVPDPETAAETLVCQSADEFYLPPGREAIGRFCERFLNENALTPSELLHSARHQTSLSNHPLFVSMIQQAERAQGRRLGTLNALVNDVAKQTRDRARDWPIPEVAPGTYEAVIAEVLSRDAAFTGRFLVDAALALHIQTARTFAEKAEMLLDLASGTEDPDALAPIDQFLAEIIRAESGMASLGGETPFVPLVEAIVALAAGDAELPGTLPLPLRQLETLVRRAPMPLIADALMVAFRRELAKPDRFATNGGDLFGVETVQRELMTLAAMAQRLRSGDGYLGGPKTEAAFQRRMSLLVSEDTLPEMVKGRSFIQKLRTLFAMQAMPLAPNSKRAVDEYLKSYLDSREFTSRVLDCWKERSDKLKGLAEVQKMILDSSFMPEDREYLAQLVDETQNAFIRTHRLLAALTSKVDPSPDTVLDMVKLAAEGAFCVGKSRTAVARALYRQVHRPRFIRTFLLSAPNGKERGARASWLKASLSMVGVPFIDMGALRVLVVDDEEGPRMYVESVLRDLGVGTVHLACDGQEALERFEGDDQRYHLIICDWMMPKVSGLEVLKSIRAARPELPFLMVTALATRQAVERAIVAQVTAYIAKPFTPDQLEDKVLMVLTQKAGL
ncbi:response regulator [Azospirillum sp.]|uniref:response regulator n=1 Tax=Azospirillum sp. TaxID=34012 RepID=UPI003D71FA16